MLNIRYDMMTAHFISKETRHPQEVMEELGVSYKKAVPQTIMDQWWFFDCKGITVPEMMNYDFLALLREDPTFAVGHGLSEEDVKQLLENHDD